MARLTEDWIKNQITGEQWHTFPNTLMTVCCLTLKNGYNVIGQAACADPAIFDQNLGQDFAYKDAISKVWPLEGYRLKQKLYYNKDVSDYPV